MARQINEFLPSSERSGQTMHGSNKSWHEAQEEREAQAEHHKRRMHRLWQVMRETRGKANPNIVRQVLAERLQ